MVSKENSLGGAYLIHFDFPYHHARHYLGWSENIPSRLAAHRSGQGARLLQVLNDNSIDYVLARVWFGADRNFERWLKMKKNSPQLCPICRGGADG